MNQKDDFIEVFTRPEIYAATLWLHGLGVGPSDMDGLVTRLTQSRELGLHHLAPGAPIIPLTVNDGHPSRAWFDVLGDPQVAGEDREGIERSAARIRQILDEEAGRGIPASQTILGGFSQGGVLALHVGLRYHEPLAGIVVLSGELALADLLEQEVREANRNTPILMMHGRNDEHIPLEDARKSYERLRSLGYAVEWQEFDCAHTVSSDQLPLIDQWIHDRLAPAIAEA